VRSAKNDQESQGIVAFCLASEMFRWMQRARMLPGDPFLTCRGPALPDPRWLDYKPFLTAINNAASLCGFEILCPLVEDRRGEDSSSGGPPQSLHSENGDGNPSRFCSTSFWLASRWRQLYCRS